MTHSHASTRRADDAPSPQADDTQAWSDARLLGFTPMDEVHREFYDVTLALLRSSEASVLDDIAAFEAHARSHFLQEDEWMRSTEFPARDCHLDEHAAVLASTVEVREAIEHDGAGIELARDFARHLLNWFPGHADYLDSALAAWMCKRAFGGKPIVLRRPARQVASRGHSDL